MAAPEKEVKKNPLNPPVDENGNVMPLTQPAMVKFRRPFSNKLARYPAHVRGGVAVPAGTILPRDCEVLGPVPDDIVLPAADPAEQLIAEARAEAQRLIEEAEANIAKMYAGAAGKTENPDGGPADPGLKL